MTKEPFDRDDLDNAVHGIHQMVLVALNAEDNMLGCDANPGFFQLPKADGETLAFALSDLLERVETLRENLAKR